MRKRTARKRPPARVSRVSVGGVAVLLLLIGLMAGAAFAWLDYDRYTHAPLPVPSADATTDVARGTSYPLIVAQLRREGVIAGGFRYATYWRVLGRELGVAGRLHAGEYALPQGITPRELLRRMADGEVVQHRFTIVDGWTFRQARLALANEPGLEQTLPGASDEDIAKRVGIADGRPEGWFLPETYAWVKGESDFDVLKRAHLAMQKTLEKLWVARAGDTELETPYQALILASIVEKETAQPAERPVIAGVFARRLKFHMRLQTDPTVIYGMGDGYAGNIRRADLETDTPFNTYTRDGLPPTPIALPGAVAIEAALHPAPGDVLYFVARGDGSHEFTPTLEAHNRAVQKYQLRRGP
ncbi:MAG: endolytic transglycosylase MltG [Dokdonella sp.]|uniref:endolytic transglycosylase MltG n=1 Tax=Dokdonella sp. TaxID=2291710 RepID=UPI003263796F